MENLKSWAVCVVASSAVATVIELLVPEGRGEKAVKFLTSVFVLLAFVSPFADFEPLAIEYTQGIDDFVESNELEKQVEEQARQSLEAQIISMLSAFVETTGAVCEEVKADVEINGEKDISLKGITVYLRGGSTEIRQKINEYSLENFGVEPQIEERE